jgi:phenol 2-monooxygenase (NADPH)
LTLLLARYGLSDESLLCLDAKPGTLKSGQADGLQPRTLEVLKSLGIANEILDDGCHMNEVAFWNPKQTSTLMQQPENFSKGIERTSFVPDVTAAARYQHEVTIHQGRIERILAENLSLYSQRGIEHSHRFIGFRIDEAGDPDYPVLIEVERIADLVDERDAEGPRRILRAKHLVGADGAHSQVRRAMGLKLEGETTDQIWGVVDFVADTDFPDVRKRSAIHSDAGSVMVIPRERISTGQYLTRLYVQIKEEVAPDPEVTGSLQGTDTQSGAKSGKDRRAAITLEYIFEQAQRVFAPYRILVKTGTEVDWWAAYQIGQRMTQSFSKKGTDGVERVFIVGDGKGQARLSSLFA